MIYKTFEEWMKNVKNIDPAMLQMPAQTWDKYLDEYNQYKHELLLTTPREG
ncbi:hypothetical protein [Priestia megaterium]|uniref:hypothetical protein n=1 Tax=Priestia megaterium TaxID=1404 RepID=UPI001A93E243|nr:hypothetical protein [Priestia megaterium]NGY76098.1 hypothetical protein [Priestia megaterium]QSX24175.1 hypothetical protein J0P05_31605 [Priestia megaterium]